MSVAAAGADGRTFDPERDWGPIAQMISIARGACADRPMPLDASADEAGHPGATWDALGAAARALACAGRRDRAASLDAADAADASGCGLGRMLGAAVRAWWAGDLGALLLAGERGTWWRPASGDTVLDPSQVRDAVAVAARIKGTHVLSDADRAGILLGALGPATLAAVAARSGEGQTLGEVAARAAAASGEPLGDLGPLEDCVLDRSVLRRAG